MTPEEIVADLRARNENLLAAADDAGGLSRDELLALLDKAAMQGFRFGSQVAMSMVRGALVVQTSRAAAVKSGLRGAD